jgi:aminoglycoside phosphotransferase (APT) family kinase protein
MTELDDAWLTWAADALGGDRLDVRAHGLRDDAGPWAVESAGRSGVLRVGTDPVGVEKIRTEVAALRFLAGGDIPAPGLLAVREEGALALELIELMDGSSAVPRLPDETRLARFGAVVGRIARLTPPPSWPRKTTPIDSTDFAAMLRESPHPLLEEGWHALEDAGPADGPDALVHGDLWHGNTMWRDDQLVAVIDWDHAGRGPAGLDLGTVRFDAALYFGEGAEDAVLAGWERESSRPAPDVAYWDALAAVSSPPDLAWFVPTMIADGQRPDLDRPTLIARRDAFLERALRRLHDGAA